MNYNHEAIRAAYPDKNLLIIDDIGIFDRDISDTTTLEIDQALVAVSYKHLTLPTTPYV